MLNFTPDLYPELLKQKQRYLQTLLNPYYQDHIDVYASSTQHFRMRAEFRVWHDETRIKYVMFPPRNSGKSMQPFEISDYPYGSILMNQLMTQLLDNIKDSDLLRTRLFQADFLTSTTGEALISLLYHKKLDENWKEEAHHLKKRLGENIHLIGRSRKQKMTLDQDFIHECLTVNGHEYHYQQVENSFTQPNAFINEHMLEWAQTQTQNSQNDLLELYCGNGNFTIALAKNFRNVLATEISKSSVQSAEHNFKLNKINNVSVVRISSEELSQHVQGIQKRKRLHAWQDFQFSCALVDPPRSGLDPHSVEVLKKIPNIIYISCNPNTLIQNLEELTQTHTIIRTALFDQFPYTDHIETGIRLQKTL